MTWLLSVGLLLMAITAGASLLLPPLAKALGAQGLGGLKAVALLLGVAAIGFFLALPALLALKVYRFAHAMGRRGWELETCRRVPIREVVQLF